MEVRQTLGDLYRDYYDGAVAAKRAIAARQTVSHLFDLLPHRPYHSVIDIGAGEGAVLAELEKHAFATELHALEISESGINAIRSRHLKTLRAVDRFDGYRMPERAQRFSVGLAAHVLEHVEHERAFIRAIVEAAELVYIEVPLEHTVNVERAIRLSGPYGHINFYTPETFQNLLKTSSAEVVKFRVFANSLEYERFVSGTLVGTIKYLLRVGMLRLFPSLATRRMTYLAAAVCRKIPAEGDGGSDQDEEA